MGQWKETMSWLRRDQFHAVLEDVVWESESEVGEDSVKEGMGDPTLEKVFWWDAPAEKVENEDFSLVELFIGH